MALGGLPLLALSASQSHLKRAVNEAVLEFSRQHPMAVVLTNLESVMLNDWNRLAGREFVPGLTAIGAFSGEQRAAVSGRQVFLLSHPGWPEFQGKIRPPLLSPVNARCLEPATSVAAVLPQNLAAQVSRMVLSLRQASPAVVAKHLQFVDNSLSASPVRVAMVDLECLQLAVK
jgi:hypothetical protein